MKYVIEPNARINILVGDNEVGKSSVLEAIDIVASGNVRRVEAIGLDKLLNIKAVQQFNDGARKIENLPELRIELYLSGCSDPTVNGKNNTDGVICDGIRLVCKPNMDYQTEITESLQTHSDYFPYDYYSIRFSTFADDGYTGYKKKLRSVMIDSTNMGSDCATNDFIKRMYEQYTEADIKERAIHQSKYRQMKIGFQSQNLKSLNSRVPAGKDYTFGLRSSSLMDFESDLMIYENAIGIDNKGTGKQVFIKTDFALEHSGTNVDVILIEEPENHLSYTNLRKLIQRVSDTQNGQLFVTTHNSLISTRLELTNLIILHTSNESKPTMLKNLSEETAEYFMKVPPANIIEFALAQKVILVEGPSEYILFERFYKTVTGCKPEEDNVRIMDIRGLSFKRYLEIAKLIGCRVAVVTDNDSNWKKNCVQKYANFSDDANIKINYETDNTKRTFEVALYADNKSLCDGLFGDDAQEYMLSNKTEAAYKLLNQDKPIAVPSYIKGAIGMDKTIILAVAGAGKTSYIVDRLSNEKRSLIVTYTDNNYINLENKIRDKFHGIWPDSITLMTYFTFLYRFCFKPFLSDIVKAKGILFKKNSNRFVKQDNINYFLSPSRYLYSNRLAFLLEKKGIVAEIQERISKYFDEFVFDEVQDIAGRDFSFMEKLMETNVNMLFVGDFYQHTFDTSRDGNVNCSLYNNETAYKTRFLRKGFVCDSSTLKRSWRCSSNVCDYVRKNLGINIYSNRLSTDNTKVLRVTDANQIQKILNNDCIIKLHYQRSLSYGIGHKNWGDIKGEDCYQDICVILNKTASKLEKTGQLCHLAPSTKNKLYVAITRAKGNVYIIDEA
jgi:hypothetical protein